MKLTEVLVCIAIFLITCVTLMSTFTNVRRNVLKSQDSSRSVSGLLRADSLLRKEIRMLDIPYWKCFSREYELDKEKLLIIAAENGIEVSSINSVYDEKNRVDGVEIEWNLGGKSFVTKEYISQRIVDEN